MSAQTFPAQIEPFKWAEQGFNWSGQLPLSRFSRLAQDAVGSVEAQRVQVDCKLSKDNYRPIAWLDAQLALQINLPCQRCLQAVNVAVEANVHVAIVNDEATVEHLEEDADFIIIGEDLGTQKGGLHSPDLVDLIYILEDELLLSIPNSPKHDACEMVYRTANQTATDEKTDNPFSVLAGLKGKLGS